jgi:hypothetical protein
VRINSVDTFKRRLRQEIVAVQTQIKSHHQQAEAMTKRLDGLKRADELFKSDHAAIVELLQAIPANRSGVAPEKAVASASTTQRVPAAPEALDAQKHLGGPARINHDNITSARAKPGARTMRGGALTRVDMIAAVLRRHPHRTVRELIALLDKEFRWKANESAVTGKLYTLRDRFVHTQPDLSTNRPVTWSLK